MLVIECKSYASCLAIERHTFEGRIVPMVSGEAGLEFRLAGLHDAVLLGSHVGILKWDVYWQSQLLPDSMYPVIGVCSNDFKNAGSNRFTALFLSLLVS